ncbi:Rho guanine nucleotide exchange factor gef1 [Fusarium austroafricanum]|uniref:Rho guanine nucleotide exchange factor gef1 n=1 Tax=Fusarium austroafricanum TaxID=2364996 RepID=A0A8H4KRV8_9HYPO|nr:Rho guanine nucleotide exchange factor gef1 [Fusarium austroafricanum]
MDNDMDMALHAGLQADIQDVDSGFRNLNLEPHHDLRHLSQQHRNQRSFNHDHDHRTNHDTDPRQEYLSDQLPHDRHQHLLDYSPSAAPASYSDHRSAYSHPSVPRADDHESLPTGAHHAFAPVNPDDFYKSYRGTNQKNLEFTSTGASAPRPSLRSNGDGSTPKHPVISQTQTNMRSTSNPVDNRPGLPGYKPTGTHPSVRDLKRRFDQNGTAPSSIPRAPAHMGAAAKIRQDVGSSPQPRNGTTSYSTLRDGSSTFSNQTASSSARSQRLRYVAEDQVSNNSQSFASRIGKPRSTVSGNSNASKSTSNLAPESPPQQATSSSTSPTPSRSQGLLFGEILPEQHNFPTAGYGIEGVRPRRTSESSLHHPFSHQRSLSDPPDVAEPSSPSIWYRSLNGDDSTGQPVPAPHKGHTRSHSDIPKSPAILPVSRKTPSRKPPTTNTSGAGSTSKLPRSVRKVNSPSDSAPSTRSNSPTLKRPQVNGRASRAETPTTRAKTPTQSGVTRKAAPRTLVTPTNNNRLQANIIAPPPKLSPPLRSSRPRQPVSVATTASSRMRAVERARSPNPTSIPQSKIAEPSSRRRKISVGPIDFEQRREHIRLAYTKSIRESQALEARQKAADRRRREMEAAAKAKATAAAAAATTSSASNSPSATPEPGTSEPTEVTDIPPVPPLPEGHSLPLESQSSEPDLDPEIPNTREVQNALNVIDHTDASDFPGSHEVSYDQAHAEPRQDHPSPFLDDPTMSPVDIAMALPPASLMLSMSSQETPTDEPSPQNIDSPTLGVPGSFPALSPPIGVSERPQTAASATSETTEFDNEPQMTPPRSAQTPLQVPITIIKPPSPQTQKPASPPRAEYRYPFEDDPDSPVRPKPALNTLDVVEHAQSKQDVDSPVIPGAFEVELESDDRHQDVESYETTITILPPSDESRIVEKPQNIVPFPRIEPDYESECHSDSEYDGAAEHYHHFHDDGAVTDSCTEDMDDGSRNDYRSEAPSDDRVSSHRASTCESSDTNHDHHYTYDEHQRPESSTNLMVPTLSAPNRTSQQSTWTDFSVNSSDVSPAGRSPVFPNVDDEDESGDHGHVTIFETTSIHRNSRPVDRPLEIRSSQPEVRPSADSTQSPYLSHQLPELDTGDGFSIPYLSNRASKSFSYFPSPNHEPPPIPASTSGSACNSQRASGVYCDQSQSGSTFVNSERGSEDYIPMMTTPQSMDNGSLSTHNQYFADAATLNGDATSEIYDKHGPTGKEKQRLVQRRNVIKELVDTEAVFVRDMNIVEEIYKGTAEACPKLDGNTVKLIFRNTDEIIAFHTSFFAQIKEAVLAVYAMQGRRSALAREGALMSEPSQFNPADIDDAKDRSVLIGPVFKANMEKMKLAHEGFLRNSDGAAKRLIQIQQDPTVKVWLNECNEVAKDLTAAWDLDSLLIKPMQRITKYPNLIITLLQHTPQDHPDREGLIEAKEILETAIIEINKTKKNFELVGQIVGRKRKESDVKAGFARAFGKRVDKLQASGARASEDSEYSKLNEKFGDDYLRLQVVLRDVEFYTRQVSAYVHEFLQYLSSIELVMRLQPGNYPELESKWVQFNISIRDLEKVALEEHLSQVRKHVIEPFEHVIKAYGNPSLAMKKRQKRRVDYERYEQLKRGGKSIDSKLNELVEQYEALNDTLKKELPKLSALTEKVGNICLGNFVNIQTRWYGIWKDKMKMVLGDCPDMPDLKEVVATFQRDFPYAQEQLASVGILNPMYRGRVSQSTTRSTDESSSLRILSRPSESDSRGRGHSISGEQAPAAPAPEFAKRHSGSYTSSPTTVTAGNIPSPHQYYYRDYYGGIGNHQQGTASPLSPELASSTRSFAASTRPSTGRSFDSGGLPRQSSDSATQQLRDSHTTYSSQNQSQEGRRFSGLFHSALPPADGLEDSARSSRASSRERGPTDDGYNVLWLAASLFEFNIATTKHEAGYPYLVYQAGEIFDVLGEKGELWLAKNQDDPDDRVGWIWSKHFARLADS